MSCDGFQPMVKMLNNDSLPPRNLFGIQSHMREDGIRITRCLLRSHGFQPMAKVLNNNSLPPRNLFGIQSQMREDGMGYFARIHCFKHPSGDTHIGGIIRGSYRGDTEMVLGEIYSLFSPIK